MLFEKKIRPNPPIVTLFCGGAVNHPSGCFGKKLENDNRPYYTVQQSASHGNIRHVALIPFQQYNILPRR